MHIELSSEATCRMIRIRNVQVHFLLLTSELSYNCPHFKEGNADAQFLCRTELLLSRPCSCIIYVTCEATKLSLRNVMINSNVSCR
jgi:hypothetical protein